MAKINHVSFKMLKLRKKAAFLSVSMYVIWFQLKMFSVPLNLTSKLSSQKYCPKWPLRLESTYSLTRLLSCQSNWTFWISYFPRHLTKHFWLLHFGVESWKMSRFRIFPIEKMSHQHHFKTSYLNWMKWNWLNFSFLVCLHFSAVTITWIGIFQIIFRVGLKKASVFRIKTSKVSCFDKQMWKKNSQVFYLLWNYKTCANVACFNESLPCQ